MTEGLANLQDVIARLEQATADAREATRELHSAIKDYRAEKKAVEAICSAVKTKAYVAIEEVLQPVIDTQVDQIHDGFNEFAASERERINEYIRKTANMALYGNTQGKGLSIFDEMRDQLMAARNGITGPCGGVHL